MKQQQPIRALGIYHDIDGLWQRAIVVSDGIDVLEVHPLERMETPAFAGCDLIGTGSVPGRMPPCDPTQLAAQSGVNVISDLRLSDLSLRGVARLCPHFTCMPWPAAIAALFRWLFCGLKALLRLFRLIRR